MIIGHAKNYGFELWTFELNGFSLLFQRPGECTIVSDTAREKPCKIHKTHNKTNHKKTKTKPLIKKGGKKTKQRGAKKKIKTKTPPPNEQTNHQQQQIKKKTKRKSHSNKWLFVFPQCFIAHSFLGSLYCGRKNIVEHLHFPPLVSAW